MFGPLFRYELVRLARKGSFTLLRCAYALVVFLILYDGCINRFPGEDPVASASDSKRPLAAVVTARATAAFAGNIVAIQFLTILVLTPAYLAGAIAGERERGTLELLFTTQLSDREIVLGKLAARVTHLAGIFLASLPVLAIAQVWGGGDFFVMLATFLAAGLNVIAIGSLSILCSTRARTDLGAFTASFGLAVLLMIPCCALPFGLAATSPGLFDVLRYQSLAWTSFARLPGPLGRNPLGPVFVCVVYNGLIALVAVGLAVFFLRRSGRPAKAVPEPSVRPAPSVAKYLAWQAARTRPLADRLPSGWRLLLWREMNPDIRIAPPSEWSGVRFCLVVAILLAVVGRVFPADLHAGRDSHGLYVAVITVLLFFPFGIAWSCFTALLAAASVCGERERRTLDGLLTLPVSRAGVLGAKWLGAVLAPRPYYYGLVCMAALCVSSGASPLPRVLLLTVVVSAQLAFLASLGLRVSVASGTTVRAQVAIALLLILFFGGGWMASGFDPSAREILEHTYRSGLWNDWGVSTAHAPGLPAATVRALIYDVGANPFHSWLLLTFGIGNPKDAVFDPRFDAARHATVAWSALAYGLAAAVLWLDAWRCLRAARNS
jgi:ABC-type transport system involved in multi-copper enzyme maturation permease subunit